MAQKIRYFSVLSAIIVVFIAGSVLFFSDKIMASASDNIRGWIWAENIGWISLNSVNCDSDGNHITDAGNYSQCPTGATSVDYGVSISQPNGSFSGYAWSENVGWVSFAPVGPYPAAPSYSACIDWPASISISEPCNGNGNYKTSLAAGLYIVDAPRSGIGSSNLPQTILIAPGKATNLDIGIDTGIR